MSPFSKCFVLLNVFVVILKIEFFPFSNYQMYSNLFNPADVYKYLEIVLVSDNSEFKFKNKRFGLFHAEQPLVESYYRNTAVKGNGYSQDFLSGIYLFKNVQQYASGMRLNSLEFNWSEYKESILNNQKQNAKLFIKTRKIDEYFKK